MPDVLEGRSTILERFEEAWQRGEEPEIDEYLPMLWVGVQVLARKLFALWSGLLLSGVLFFLTVIFNYQDRFGFNFDMGGLFATPESRAPLFALLFMLALIACLVYFAGLIAYYSNWDLMRGPQLSKHSTSENVSDGQKSRRNNGVEK